MNRLAMHRRVLFVLLLWPWLAGVAAAQAPAVNEAAKNLIGSWEFSNADREKLCTITFRADASTVGMKVEFAPVCAGLFPFVRDVVGWTYPDNDFLRLFNAQGQAVLEFSEVESGIFEAPRPGEGILFIQNAIAAGPAPKTAEQIIGQWSVVRGAGKPVCGLTLSDAKAGDDYAVRVTPPCDALVTRFGPASWQVDRGEIILKSARGQSWRFEEGDGGVWQRVPPTADPILLKRR
jgi:hypothetical protein